MKAYTIKEKKHSASFSLRVVGYFSHCKISLSYRKIYIEEISLFHFVFWKEQKTFSFNVFVREGRVVSFFLRYFNVAFRLDYSRCTGKDTQKYIASVC